MTYYEQKVHDLAVQIQPYAKRVWSLPETVREIEDYLQPRPDVVAIIMRFEDVSGYTNRS